MYGCGFTHCTPPPLVTPRSVLGTILIGFSHELGNSRLALARRGLRAPAGSRARGVSLAAVGREHTTLRPRRERCTVAIEYSLIYK